jgi:DNA-binding NarL/FixJ family response regulator
MSDRTSVLLVDDHAVVREGYRRLLERAGDMDVVGEAATAAEAGRMFASLVPDVVVMDVSLPDVSGIEALRRILARDANARVLMFSIHDETVFPRHAFAAGARGYVTKASAPDVLVDAVRAVAAGERFLSADVAHDLALQSLPEASRGPAALTTREFEIARLLSLGHSLRDVAERMHLSPKTIANHQSAIRQKLGVANAAQFLSAAAREG